MRALFYRIRQCLPALLLGLTNSIALGFVTSVCAHLVISTPSQLLLWVFFTPGAVGGIFLTVKMVRFARSRRRPETPVQPSSMLKFHCPLPECQYVSEKDGLCPTHFMLLKAQTRENRSTP